MEEEKQPRISYRRMFRMLWPTLKTVWFLYVLLFCVVSFLSALAVAEPFLYGKIVDSIVQSVQLKLAVAPAFRVILPFLGFWAVFVLMAACFDGTFNISYWFVGNRVSNRFHTAFYRHLLTLDVRTFYEVKGGEMLRRFDGACEAVWEIHRYITRDCFPALTRFSLALGVGLYIDWRLTLVTLVPVPLILFIGIFNLKYTQPNQRKVGKLYDEAYGLVGDGFDNIASMKAFRGETRSADMVSETMKKAEDLQWRVNRLWGVGETIIGPIYLIGRLAIFFAGAIFIFQGTTTIGTLIMFLGFVSFIYGSVQQVSFSLPDVARNIVRLNRATEYWEAVPEVKDRSGAKTVKRLKGEVTFDRVVYGYNDGNSVLHGVSFTIPVGQTLALIGESGAGKSTLAQMMLRFHDPKSGHISIDGIDIRDMKLDSLRANVGCVMQENLLFHDTILNNIRFAKPSASEKEIMAAAKRAQAHEFIKGLKNGYKTIVGERGVKLSGGEKQRVALARVLLADPPILVLDEATSALDSKTEHALQTALHEVMKNRTTLVIAHRLSTVMNADNILVMHKGRIVDHGKHADLIQRGGLYKQYWEIQAGGYV